MVSTMDYEFTSDELKAQYGDVDKFYIIRVQDVRGKAEKKQPEWINSIPPEVGENV